MTAESQSEETLVQLSSHVAKTLPSGFEDALWSIGENGYLSTRAVFVGPKGEEEAEFVYIPPEALDPDQQERVGLYLALDTHTILRWDPLINDFVEFFV